MRTMLMACFLAPVAVAMGCSSTKVTRTWKDQAASTAQLQDVLVVAVVRQEGPRRTLEDKIAAELKKKGVSALPSHKFFPAGEELNRDAVREVVQREKFDHVLLTNYAGTETEVDYVPGYYSYHGYYGYMGGVMASPGYYRTTTTVTLQTRLFGAEEGGKLLWSANSKTTDPSGSEGSIGGVAEAIVDKLSEDVPI